MSGNVMRNIGSSSYAPGSANTLSQPDKKRVWEVVSITLLAAIAVSFLVDFILDQRITWSEYPIAVCLIIFSYISLLAFVRRSQFFEMAGGFVIASIFTFNLGCPYAWDKLGAQVRHSLTS